jgi:hypothetical protein
MFLSILNTVFTISFSTLEFITFSFSFTFCYYSMQLLRILISNYKPPLDKNRGSHSCLIASTLTGPWTRPLASMYSSISPFSNIRDDWLLLKSVNDYNRFTLSLQLSLVLWKNLKTQISYLCSG